MDKAESLIYRKPEESKEGIPAHEIELIIDNERVGIAYLEYHSKPFPFYELAEIKIKYGKRGEGFGSKIMDFIENWLRERGRAGVLTNAIAEDSLAKGMYERRGWQLVPGSRNIYAYNLPDSVKIEQLSNIYERIK